MSISIYTARTELHKFEDRLELGEVLTADEKSRMGLMAAIVEDHDYEMRMIAQDDIDDRFYYEDERY